MAPVPHRGEIWPADFHPTWGRAPAGARPVLVISTNTFNYGPAPLVFVLPVTRTDRRIPLHVPIDPPEGGVTTRSYIVCDTLYAMAKARLGPQAWGRVSAATLQTVMDHLCLLLALPGAPHRLRSRPPGAAWRQARGGGAAREHEMNGQDLPPG